MPDPRSREARISDLDRLLQSSPDEIDALFERASLLRESGRFEEAKRDYLHLLARAPGHFGALNDFGTLLVKAGYRDAARTVYREAVSRHPDNPAGHINFGNFLFLADDLAEARGHFESALRLDPAHCHAHRGMANVLAELGDDAGAWRHRDQGFKDQFLTTLPFRGDGHPVKVLLLVSAVGGNIPTDSIIDDRFFQTHVLAAEYYKPDTPLPPHDVIFNAIGDADLCRQGLDAAAAVLARTKRPFINHPSAVLRTGRVANVRRLRDVPDVIAPRMASVPRAVLLGREAASVLQKKAFQFPLLVRSPGFHTGRHFVRVERCEDLAGAVATLPGEDLWVIEALDASDRDGKFRKCRVMIVDRKLYPLHQAVSSNWKVHYFTAGMAESAEHRALDAAFLENMTAVIGTRGIAALERIRDVLGLDYGGIDFAVDAEGRILLFEANASMVVPAPLTDPKWAYRRPAIERIISAVHKMLVERTGR